jgi:hypothetical protein
MEIFWGPVLSYLAEFGIFSKPELESTKKVEPNKVQPYEVEPHRLETFLSPPPPSVAEVESTV